jgi:hypothetical protein
MARYLRQLLVHSRENRGTPLARRILGGCGPRRRLGSAAGVSTPPNDLHEIGRPVWMHIEPGRIAPIPSPKGDRPRNPIRHREHAAETDGPIGRMTFNKPARRNAPVARPVGGHPHHPRPVRAGPGRPRRRAQGRRRPSICFRRRHPCRPPGSGLCRPGREKADGAGGRLLHQ